MKNRISNIIVFAVFAIFFASYSPSSHAQVDPSNSLLLKSNDTSDTSAPANNQNLDNGRYVIKPAPPAPAPVVKTTPPKPVVKVVPAKPAQMQMSIPVAPTIAKPVVVTPPPAPTAPSTLTPATTPQQAPDVEAPTSFARSLQDSVMGGSSDDIAHYKEKLQPDDPRHNIIEVSVAPGYLYVNSSSSYWYRRYFSSGPGIDLNAEMWLTPFLGIDLGYFTTLTSDMNADPVTSRTIVINHHYTDFAFEFRKYFSLSKKSPSLKFRLGYSEYQMVVPPTEIGRVGLQEYGLDLGLNLTLPATNYYAWSMSTDFIPDVNVNEQATGVSVHSGNNAASYALKFSLGQDFTLDRNNKVFWRLTHRLVKTVYSGVASHADPISGTAPTGVSVNEGASLFEFGYSWGD